LTANALEALHEAINELDEIDLPETDFGMEDMTMSKKNLQAKFQALLDRLDAQKEHMVQLTSYVKQLTGLQMTYIESTLPRK
jgi:hypothetical protein